MFVKNHLIVEDKLNKALFIIIVLLFAPTVYSNEIISDENWFRQPKIIEIHNIFNEINNSIYLEEFSFDIWYSEDYQPYSDSVRKIYCDTNGIIRRLNIEKGSDDSAIISNYFYDSFGNLRYILITAGAVNGSSLIHKIYFDINGNRIWELHEYIDGPGYTFPAIWPEEEVIYNPQNYLSK